MRKLTFPNKLNLINKFCRCSINPCKCASVKTLIFTDMTLIFLKTWNSTNFRTFSISPKELQCRQTTSIWRSFKSNFLNTTFCYVRSFLMNIISIINITVWRIFFLIWDQTWLLLVFFWPVLLYHRSLKHFIWITDRQRTDTEYLKNVEFGHLIAWSLPVMGS